MSFSRRRPLPNVVAMRPTQRPLCVPMAERRSLVSQMKKPPPSTRAEGPKRGQTRPQAKSESGPADVFFAKEEQYKLLNAELEAKTAALVKQAERLVKEQNEALSKPLSSLVLTEFKDEEDPRTKPERRGTSGVKLVSKKRPKSASQTPCAAKQEKPLQAKTQVSKVPHADKVSVEDEAHCFLAETIRGLEEQTSDTSPRDDVRQRHDALDDVEVNVGSEISDAQIRVFKAKLRIMQEELDQLSSEYYKKDDENAQLSATIKELEDDRARLQKTAAVQQTQIEKQRALAEEANRKCQGLQLQVSALNKEVENLNRHKKQAAAAQSSVEVRLNRAVEEVERLKTQLSRTQQINRDKISVEHQSKENLLAENKMLKKQKAELIVGFKKQLKLIDVLKRQKMHFEAAKLLSFTEDEFMKALDWGKV